MARQTTHRIFWVGMLLVGLGWTSSLPAQTAYQVVINHEEQYAVWLQDQEPPKGWKETGKSGPLDRCQRYISEVWTDMRPLTIRKMGFSDQDRYAVVINHEEQYLIWPVEVETAKAWKVVAGTQGSLAECTAYIEKVWTDMRPLSLRKRLWRRNE